MVGVIVRGASDKVIRAHIVRGVSGPPEPTHAYLQVNGVTHKVLIGRPTDLTESEIFALRDSGYSVEEVE